MDHVNSDVKQKLSKLAALRAASGVQPLQGRREIVESILAKCRLDPNTNCLLWTGITTKEGYGLVRAPPSVWLRPAHKELWKQLRGRKLRRGQDLENLCGNPNCANLQHWKVVGQPLPFGRRQKRWWKKEKKRRAANFEKWRLSTLASRG